MEGRDEARRVVWLTACHDREDLAHDHMRNQLPRLRASIPH
jgi:hypothetical protein